jgi:hypothetical protein
MQKKWKKQKANQQNPKKYKSKIKGEKNGKEKESEKGKKWGNNGLVHFFPCFSFLTFLFFPHLFCFRFFQF